LKLQTSFLLTFAPDNTTLLANTMEQMQLDISRVYEFISEEEINQLSKEALSAQNTLYQGDGQGNDYLG